MAPIVFDGKNFRTTGLPVFKSKTGNDFRQPDHPIWGVGNDVLLQGDSVVFTTGMFPEEYRQNFYGDFPIPWRTIGEDRSTVYVFEASDEVHMYDMEGVLQRVSSVHSIYDTVDRKPFSFESYDLEPVEYQHEYEASESFYRKVVWDQWRKQYYVLFFHPQPTVEENEINHELDRFNRAVYHELSRNWSLIVLNRDLDVTAEYFIPGGVYDPMMLDVIREGVVFPHRNRTLPGITNSVDDKDSEGCVCRLNTVLFNTYFDLKRPSFEIYSSFENFKKVR